MKRPIDERIKQAQKQLSELRLQRRETNARIEALNRQQTRKQDFRRKLLAGAWFLTARPELVPEFKASLANEDDRSLF